MRTSYRPLFSLECLHSYFAGGVCRALDVRPAAPNWERLSQRHELLFRPAIGGGTVYYDEHTTDLDALYADAVPFLFALTCTDSMFQTYTEVGDGAAPLPGERLHYFSNHELFTAELNGRSRTLLHEPASPFAEPLLPVRPPQFTHRFHQPMRGALLQVVDVRGQVAWEAQTSDVETAAWNIDLRGCCSGRYRLNAADEVLDFFLSELPGRQQWGAVEIVPKASPDPATFTMAFDRRETIWRYYIVDRPQDGTRYEHCDVRGSRRGASLEGMPEGEEIQFHRREGVTELRGRRSFVFESVQPIPLLEVPAQGEYVFTLQGGLGTGASGRARTLPFAQPTSTRLEGGPDGTRMYSEMFVYL